MSVQTQSSHIYSLEPREERRKFNSSCTCLWVGCKNISLGLCFVVAFLAQSLLTTHWVSQTKKTLQLVHSGSLGNHTQTDASICLSSISSFFLQSLQQTAGIYYVSLSEELGELVLEVFNAVGQGLEGYGSQLCGWRWFSITRRLLRAITCPCGLIKKVTENPRSTAFNNIIVSRSLQCCLHSVSCFLFKTSSQISTETKSSLVLVTPRDMLRTNKI